MDVKATIVAHECAGPSEGGHRFVFTIQDEINPPKGNVISLRLARFLAGELTTSTAFGQMIMQIVRTDPQFYDSLVNQEFKHV